MSRRALALLLASAAALPAGAAFAQTSDAVTDLGTIGNYAGSSTILTTSDQLSNGEQTQTDTSLGYAISGDGSTVVGTSVAAGGNGHAFVWTAAGGMTDIGALFPGGNAIAEGVDNAGDVVVGFSTVSGGYWQAFRWTKAGGMVDIGAIGTGTYSFASAVSADGSVVVGGAYTSTTIDRAFRWTQSGGMQNLGTIGNNSGFSDALGIAQLINNELLSQVLLGLNEQISCGNCGGPYASFGSFDLGAHGRWGLGRDFTILAGFSYGQQRNAGADTKGEISVATALRYDPVELGHSRPFVEVGVTASPWQDTVYTRRYANGMGVATASGESDGQSYSVYGRVGWVARLTKRDELAISGDVGQSWQHVGAYAEATVNNPFNAFVPASTDSMASYGASAQLTHLFGRRLEADVNLGVTQSFSEASGLDADVAPVGPIAAPNQNLTYYEAGGRLGFRLRRGWTVDAFVNAVLARKALGNTAHGGLGLRVDF